MDRRPDRWRFYRLALREAGRAVARASPRRWSCALRLGTPRPTRLLFAPRTCAPPTRPSPSDIYAGFFVFAGRALATGGRSPFDFAPPTRAWGEALYGFGWLRHLRAAGTALAQANARALVDEFISTRNGDRRLARETQVAARRLISFISQSPLILEGADHAFYQRFLRAIGRLVRDLERDAARRRLPQRRLIAAIALCYAGLCCEGLERLAAPRDAASRRASSTRRSCPMAAMRAAIRVSLIELLFDLLPLRQMFASRGPTRRRRCSRHRPHAADAAPVPARRRHPVAFQRHGRDRRRPPRDAAHLRRHAQPADPARAAFRLRAPRGRPHPRSSPMSARRRRPPLDARPARAACPSSFRAAAQRIVVNCGAPRTRATTVRCRRRAPPRPIRPRPWTTSRRAASSHRRAVRLDAPRRLAPAPLGRSSLAGPASVAPSAASATSPALDASHDGYRAPLRPHARAALAALAEATRLEGEDVFSAETAHRGRARRRSASISHPASGEPGAGRTRRDAACCPTARPGSSRRAPAMRGSRTACSSPTPDGARRTEQIVLALEPTRPSRALALRTPGERAASASSAQAEPRRNCSEAQSVDVATCRGRLGSVARLSMLSRRLLPPIGAPAMPSDLEARHARPPLRVRQDRPRRFRARARRARRRARLDRRHAQGARRGRPAGARRDRPHRLSRDDGRPRQDAASGACTAGFSASAPTPSIRPRCWRTASRPIDLLVVNLYPFEATVARGRRLRRLHREHRHRRPGDDPRGRQEPRRRGGGRRRRRLRARCSPTSTRMRAPSRSTLRRRLAAEGLCAHGRLRRGDLELARRRARRGDAALPRARRHARRGACATARTRIRRPAFYRTAGAAARRRDGAAGAGQAALLQQHQRHRRRLRMRRRVRSRAHGRRRDHQARQSLRRRRGRDPRRGLREGAALRSRLRLRRHRRAEPPARRRGGAQDRRDLHRGDHRAGRRRGGDRASSARRRTCACCSPAALPDPRARRADVRTVAGGFLAQARDNAVGRRHGPEGRDEARAERARSSPTCASPSASPSTSSRTPSSTRRDGATVGIGAGQMSRVDSSRIAAWKAAEAAKAAGLPETPGAGLGRRLRRLLPLRRRPARRGRSGRHRGDPARRLDARRRGHPRRRRGGPRHGLHRPPPFPALNRCAFQTRLTPLNEPGRRREEQDQHRRPRRLVLKTASRQRHHERREE